MAHANKVIRSINLQGESICVDFFVRPDGTFGFDEYRRDPEDGRGWFSIGHYGDERFETLDAAIEKAKWAVAWLDAVMP